MRKRPLAWLAIIITTIAWASSLILAKIIFDELTPIIFVALRYTLACPFLLLLVKLPRDDNTSFASVRANWKVLLVAGLTGPFLSQVLQYIGLNMTNAGETLLLLNFTPVFAVIIAAPVLKERITADKLGGLILATIGATLIVMSGTPIDGGLEPVRLAGDLIVIVSTALFAINGILGKIAVKTVDSISVTLYSSIFAVPFIWLSAVLIEDITVLLSLSTEAWIIVFWVAIVNTILYYESMKYIEASRVQIALNLIAVWGVIMSVLVLGEQITFFQIIGGFLTVVGVIIAQTLMNGTKNLEDIED
ncbi:MAG: DMT family transporter [Candidatus Thorarchaeota archaeon]|jgi:drug/metabolite transporter (DMT)-like permease